MVIMMLTSQASVCCKCISFRTEVSVGCINVISVTSTTTKCSIVQFIDILSCM